MGCAGEKKEPSETRGSVYKGERAVSIKSYRRAAVDLAKNWDLTTGFGNMKVISNLNTAVAEE